jgi:transcriptional regulator with XRE-family HTH domain
MSPRPRKVVDTNMYSGRFAVRLRQLRDKAGLTTRELSEQTGIPLSPIQSWDGGRKSPTIDNFPILAKALGVTVRTLLPKE